VKVLRRPIEFALDAPVGMMDKLIADLAAARPDRHLQSIEGKLGAQRIRDLPPDDPAGKQISDKSGIHKTAGRIDIRDISDPALAGRDRSEVPLQQVRRARLPRRGRDCRPRLLPPGRCARDAQLTHQPLHRAPRHTDTLPAQMPPYLPRPIHTAAYALVFPHAHDLLLQPLIPHISR
jgi:hypothetical protein